MTTTPLTFLETNQRGFPPKLGLSVEEDRAAVRKGLDYSTLWANRLPRDGRRHVEGGRKGKEEKRGKT